MKGVFFVVIALMIFTDRSSGQTDKVYTLKQCVETAIENNLDVKQADLQMQTSKINWNQARLNMLPDLNASAGHGIKLGRSIDPTSNDYVNQQIKFGNYGIGSEVVIFNGFFNQHTIKQTALAYEASRLDWQQAKDNITLNIILSYLQVLSNEDLLTQVQNQVELTRQQVQRLEVLNNDGAIRPSDLYDLKGQLSNDRINLTNAKNALEIAKINLCELMNVQYNTEMKLERMDPALFVLTYNDSPEQIYDKALTQFALVRSAVLQTKSTEKAVKASRALLFPVVTLGGSSGTAYSSLDQTKYGKQLNNNFTTTIALNLQIPIFNSWFTRNRIRLARLTAKNFLMIEQTVKTQLQLNIERAYVNMQTTFERYKTLLDQVNFYRESFRAAEIRFNEGAGTTIDYLTAKNNLDRANINFIISKYDYLLRTRILDYYKGSVTW
jgi:outer membrane protein